ncbi:MAG TPA: aminotransferase class IV [Thermoanaerobaculia bacterium]|nr:aminotransferase class IV [Thermoanaerobaculia bacterium]
MSLAYWNGRLVPAGEVRIEHMLGDGLFETLRVDEGRAGDVEAHLDRLFEGLPRVGIDPPEDRETLAAALSKVAEASPWPVARMRIAITQETRLISLALYTPPAGPISAVLLPEPWIWSRSPLAGLKSLSYQANRLALRRAGGAFEALLLNERGHLVEGSRSNVILSLPDGLFTPPVEDGCLPGTVRRRLLEKGEIAERSLTPEDLRAASRVLLTNSLIGVLEVEQVGPAPAGA